MSAMNSPWTPDDLATLRRLAPATEWKAIAAVLGRSWRAVQKKANEIGIRRASDGVDWSEEEVATLRREFPIRRSAEVAAMLGRTLSAVSFKARSLGIAKDPAYLHQRSVNGGRAAFARGTFPANRLRAAPLTVPNYSPTQDAVRHLQKIGPIWRCRVDGTTDPKGDHWKFNGRVMDAAAVEARAMRAGWVAP